MYNLEYYNTIKNDKSILFATNDLSLPELFSDRIIIIHNGSVTFNGTINNLESKRQQQPVNHSINLKELFTVFELLNVPRK